MTIYFILPLLLLVAFIYSITKKSSKTDWKEPKQPFPIDWKNILDVKVSFYRNLDESEREQFERQVQEFLLNCRITGIKTEVSDEDRLLIAASAVIPIFSFPDWKYFDLHEVLLYPSSFNENYETEGEDRRILGMVGTGVMDGKMILSRHSLHLGFRNEEDKKNTAIHEFVHLIDKADGSIDGIPEVLLQQQYVLPWINLIHQKTKDILDDKSDINPYGATSQPEFLTVASEYFFERPKLLQTKHPELYKLLSKMFQQDLANRKRNKIRHEISRNEPCPCGSGQKFKRCCGK